jgi:hypothetical protein
MAETRYGATPDDWAHLDLVLDLTKDLLPVVSDPHATISANSAMKQLGKTPSKFYADRMVGGIKNWTQYEAQPKDVVAWSAEPQYGICIQTRRIKAFDFDITDQAQADELRSFLHHRIPVLPERTRANSPKFLQIFECPDVQNKRVIKTAHGIIELLATGQQFISCGCHPSGARYEWLDGGLPSTVPSLSLAQVDALWSELQTRFGVEPSKEASASSKAAKLANVMEHDPVAVMLRDHGYVIGTEKDGRLNITCPFDNEHTVESSETASVYWPSNTGGYANGHFDCKHGHCEDRSDQEFLDKIGYSEDFFSEFVRIGSDVRGESLDKISDDSQPALLPAFKFNFEALDAFTSRPPPKWIIKGVLPQADMALLIGPPASGKSFFALDLALAIATGDQWNGRRTKQGRVAYVAAEGAGGFANRVKAALQHKELDPAKVPMMVLSAAPNFMDKAEVVEVAKAIVNQGGADVIFIDTYAQVTPGADENSGKDMGKALSLCRGLHRATHALIVLLHHVGKDVSKGARGWSGLLAAADASIAIERFDSGDRMATVAKMKDGLDGLEFGFTLNTVVLGFDEDGDEITSCVLDHHNAPPKSRREKKKPLTDQQRQALALLADMLPLDGGGVDETVWRNKMKEEMGARLNNTMAWVEALVARGEVVCEGTRYFLNVKGESK